MTNDSGSNAGVISARPVLLLGAGPSSPQDIRDLLLMAPYVVAADGGASAALDAGVMPEAVIGDFDSLPQFGTEELTSSLIHVAEQETTDFEKCLLRIRAPAILALGFTGGRLDHGMAVWNALARYTDTPCIVLGEHDLVFHAPPRLQLDLPLGSRLSLFPMAPVRGRSRGLHWPIDGIGFAPDGSIGISNRVTGPVELSFEGPGMLVVMPREGLAAATDALLPPSVHVR